jgi:hypothetical protein
MTYTTYTEAMEALAAAEADTVADLGPEGWEAGAHDVIVDLAGFCTREVGTELLRTQLGITRREAGLS